MHQRITHLQLVPTLFVKAFHIVCLKIVLIIKVNIFAGLESFPTVTTNSARQSLLACLRKLPKQLLQVDSYV